MPHVIIEYTANVEADARIPELMRVLNAVLIDHADVFPTGGIRTRALRLDQYRMADGAAAAWINPDHPSLLMIGDAYAARASAAAPEALPSEPHVLAA